MKKLTTFWILWINVNQEDSFSASAFTSACLNCSPVSKSYVPDIKANARYKKRNQEDLGS